MLTMLDEYPRQGLDVAVAFKMGSADVLEALYPLLLEHGKPEFICSDNGPEFIAAALQDWLARVGIKQIQIYPSLPLSALRSNACRAVHGRMGTMSGSTARYATKF
jgi:putative transposase